MTEKQWEVFCKFKEEFKRKVEEWKQVAPELTDLQRKAALDAKTPEYPFETSVVYNRDLDKLTKDDEIKLIVIGDNPGKDEQLAKNNRYLVGQAGKIADGFFKKNAELGVDFRKNVIILNKTPVHSAKTVQLKKIMQLGGKKIERLILESQLWMAEKTAEFYVDFLKSAAPQTKQCHSQNVSCQSQLVSCHSPARQENLLSPESITSPELWLVGYSELKDKGFFSSYRDKLKSTILEKSGSCEAEDETCVGREDDTVSKKPPFTAWDGVYVFQHFSMNRFTIDLREQTESLNSDLIGRATAGENIGVVQSSCDDNSSLLQKIHFVGKKHKEEIFGL